MQWHKMSQSEKGYAREIWDRLDKADAKVSVSQVAKYLDEFDAWHTGAITAAELKRRTDHDVPEEA